MMGIDRLSSIAPASDSASQGGLDARGEAGAAMSEIGHRVLSWVSASAGLGDRGGAAWAGQVGQGTGFRPDTAELSRGGDVYGLGQLAGGIASRLGGTPAQEGALHRALGDFTRASVVQLAGLSGAAGDTQIAGVRDALDTGMATDAGEGVDGVIGRLEAATTTLVQRNGG